MKFNAEELRALLRRTFAQLPKDADEIANLFRAENVQGRCGQPSICAMAVWLNRHMPEGYTVGVAGSYVNVYDDNGDWTPVDGYAAPAAAYDFVRRFDLHRYEDLISVA